MGTAAEFQSSPRKRWEGLPYQPGPEAIGKQISLAIKLVTSGEPK